MAGFFELVGHQIDEVERIQQRCAQRVKRFTAFGTMEQSRGVARQLNEAIGAARALLKSSLHRLPPRHRGPAGPPRHQFRWRTELQDRRPVQPEARRARRRAISTSASFAALTTQVDAPAMSDMLNAAPSPTGPVSLPDAVDMLAHRPTSATSSCCGRGRSSSRQQTKPTPTPAAPTVRFRSLDGRDREIAVPRLMFTEPITTTRRSQRMTTRSRHRLLVPPPGRPDRPSPAQRRPRFDGDVSELPDRACWALQHLLTRRYISAEADADIYSWVLEYRNQLSVRLSELDLLLRVRRRHATSPSSSRPATNPQGASSFCAANRSAPTTRSSRCTSRR